jgi:pseudouridine-5'-phosphate glycosidase
MAPAGLHIAPEVAAALAQGEPVVALESTVIAHGLPRPQNLQVAQELEAEVRRGGAVPATIAVLGGELRVGLDAGGLARLAQGGTVKAAAPDLPAVMARGLDAATTVSATLVAAARAGIRLFATGGIGGVHRGSGWDVSHDLVALAREPVAVVSAGAKSILDLPRTLEALETLGVPVVGFRTSELPAFYLPSSGLALEHRFDEVDPLARLLDVHFRLLARPGGVLIVQPVAAEAALDADELAEALARADQQAAHAGITGKAVTPFLLARLAEATAGRSVTTNRALLLANARLAAAIACAQARLGGA